MAVKTVIMFRLALAGSRIKTFGHTARLAGWRSIEFIQCHAGF
jgi:hypothetical protein